VNHARGVTTLFIHNPRIGSNAGNFRTLGSILPLEAFAYSMPDKGADAHTSNIRTNFRRAVSSQCWRSGGSLSKPFV
jgi:hypothetical protein